MIIKGIKFGMLLQFAVGPMCLLVFKTANTQGVALALLLMLSIALVDGIYISLAGLGVSRFLTNEKAKKAIKIFGGIILVLFGLNIALSSVNINILPDISLFSANPSNIFLQGFLLTLSNPLTIVFWGGVLATQITENSMSKSQLFQFGIGCVLSTIVFLSIVAFVGSLIGSFLPDIAISALNSIVGLVIVAFGIKLFIPPRKGENI